MFDYSNFKKKKNIERETWVVRVRGSHESVHTGYCIHLFLPTRFCQHKNWNKYHVYHIGDKYFMPQITTHKWWLHTY